MIHPWFEKLGQVDGHWRKLPPGKEGKGPGGEPQVGRTWVRAGLKPEVRLNPHQADFVKAVEQLPVGGGIIAAHGTGCLSGDVVVKVNRAGKTFDLTMRDLHKKFHAGRWRSDIPTRIQCHVEGRVRLNTVVAVYETGEREVYEISAGNYALRATLDHRFETPSGFRRLGELTAGDEVFVRGKRNKGRRKAKLRYKLVKVAGHPYADCIAHPVSEKDAERCGYRPGHVTILKRVPEHRLRAEAALSGLDYREFLHRVRSGQHEGLKFLDPGEFAVHHKDRDTSNNAVENLEVLTHAEHHRRHAEDGSEDHALEPVISVRIEGIERVGVETTYDLTVLSPHNNYIANGFVVHNSGKTLSSIAAFEDLKQKDRARRALVLTPAGLRTNYMEKGIGKFTTSKAVILNRPSEVDPNVSYVVVSYDAFRRDPEGFMRTVQPDTVIADEFHRAANPQSLTHQAIKKVRPEVKHFMGLTASVVQNQPEEIASLMSLAAGPQAPFRSPEEFRKRYVKRVQEPGSGVFGGKVYGKRIVREEELVKRVGPTVHYVEDLDASEKPTKMVETVPVQMSPAQVDLYRMSMKGVDPKIVAKIQAGEPVSQKEAMGIFARLIRARQVSNSMHVVDPRLTPEQAAEITPKIQKVLGDAQEHISGREDAQVIMYTNIVHGGVDVLEAGLKKAGIPYATFIGRGNPGVTEESRQQAVRDYISGKVKVIVITGAGAEGLDLPNTTMVQMVDGHYNPERINQAEARGVRAGGLAHLPPEERKVQVRRYVSTLPRGFWRTILFRPPERSVEEFVYSTAQRKEKATRQLRDILARRSEHEQKRRESTAYRWFGGGP